MFWHVYFYYGLITGITAVTTVSTFLTDPPRHSILCDLIDIICSRTFYVEISPLLVLVVIINLCNSSTL